MKLSPVGVKSEVTVHVSLSPAVFVAVSVYVRFPWPYDDNTCDSADTPTVCAELVVGGIYKQPTKTKIMKKCT